MAEGLEREAYADCALPIGYGQTISQPYMVAVMAERLKLSGRETVLEIGTGSGYGAAVLALLAARVITIERIPELLDEARTRWALLGLTNIRGETGDGTLGWPEDAPYGGIVVTAGAPRVPEPLFQQLVPETGRLVIPVGDRFCQMLLVVRRGRDGTPLVIKEFPCAFVPLVGAKGWDQ